MKGKVLTLLTAVVIAVMMLAAPFGVISDSDAMSVEEITPASDASGTYGFYINETDLESVQDDVIGLIKILDPGVQIPESVNTSNLKEALQAFFDASSAGVQVNNASLDDSIIIGAAIDVKQSSNSLVIDVDAVVDLELSGYLSIEGIEGEALGDALNIHEATIEMTAAVNAKVVFASQDLYWVFDSIDAEAALSGSFAIDADLEVGPNHEEPINLPDSVDFSGNAGQFLDIQTVNVGDSKFLSMVMTSNLGTFAEDFFASLGIAEEVVIYDPSDGTDPSAAVTIDPSAASDIPSYVADTEEIMADDYAIQKDVVSMIAGIGKLDTVDLTELLLSSIMVGSNPDDSSGTSGGAADTTGIDVQALIDSVAGIARDLVGNDGIVASSSEVNDVRRAVQDSMNKSRDIIAAAESEVTFLDQQADGIYREVGTYTVKAGGSVDMSAPVIAALTEPGENMRFVGWSIVTPTVDSTGAITGVLEIGSFDNVVYSNCYVVPVYAEVVTDLDNTQDIQGDRIVVVDIPTLDFSKLPLGSTAYVEITNVGSGADKVVWTTTGSINDTSVDVGAVSEATTAKLAGKDLTKAFEVNFTEQVLPAGTQVTVYVGDRYAPGTTFEVYHVEANKVSLSQNAVTVNSEGAVTFSVPSLSSYVLVEGSIADDVPFDGSGTAPDYVSPNPVSPGGGGNWLLYGGIAIGVIVLLGVVIFLIKRR